MLYQPLVEGADELRLITILPDQEGKEAAGVCCRLDTVSLKDSFLTPKHEKYLKDVLESRQCESRVTGQNIAEADGEYTTNGGVRFSLPPEAATTKLPEFRYVWGDFIALSYTWGDPSITREILINGIAVQVTENLGNCLRVLREKDYIKKGWKIWIDALCINQTDLIERCREVTRMREIYTKAYTPLIWLGPEDGNSEKAMELVKRLASEYCGTRESVSLLTNALSKDPGLFGTGSWLAMHEFVTRRYWSRMWIIQEVVQGKKSIPVLCGRATISWAHVYPVFSLLHKCDEVINRFIQGEVQAIGSEMKLNEIWANLSTVKDIQMFQDARWKGERIPHDRLLQLGRMVSATDPRDKIYGLLGLFDTQLSSHITPNYRASVLDVYKDFVKASINTGSLDFLYHCYSTPREDFPSWLPDWSAIRLVGAPLIFGNNGFSTSGSSKARVQYLNDEKLLSCAGILYDKIDGMGHIWHPFSSDSHTVVPSTSGLNPYGNREKVQEAIWKSIVCDRDVELNPLTMDYGCLLAAPKIAELRNIGRSNIALNNLLRSNIFVWFVNSCKANAELRVCGQPLEEYFTSMDLEKIDVTCFREALVRRDHVSPGRRLLTTNKGYFGIGSDGMKRGDIVAVLMGATMPIILRKEGEYYRFVGECYIHGIMSGEVMKRLETDGDKLEDIILS